MQNVVLAITSDHHAGSTLATCPPEGVLLDDAGEYHPSQVQRWLWQCWEDYWAEIEQVAQQYDAKVYNVLNGDLFEGDHHDTTQILNGNPQAQQKVASRLLDVPRALKPDQTFVVRGTGVHVGESSSTEEGFARAISATPCPDTGTYSWWELPLHVGGWRFLFKHHPPTRGNLPHTRPNAVVRMAKIVWDEYHLAGEQPPHIAVFAHIHHFGDSGTAFPTRALVTGSWQLRTSYVHARLPMVRPEIGGLYILVRDGCDPDVRKKDFEPRRTTAWTE